MRELRIKGTLKRRWIPLLLNSVPVMEFYGKNGRGEDAVVMTIEDAFLICRMDGTDYWAYLEDQGVVERVVEEVADTVEDMNSERK